MSWGDDFHLYGRRCLLTALMLWGFGLHGSQHGAPEVSQATRSDLPAEASKRIALLVGINDYSAPAGAEVPRAMRDRGWRNLAGAVNDVEAMRDMLVGRFGFSPADVRLLTDQDAGRVAILSGLLELAKQAGRGDLVVFHYSGHGSYRENPQSPELDGLDETLVPADSMRGARDIRDKELRERFNRILNQGAKLVVIIDSCHAGSSSRGLPSTQSPRGLRPDSRQDAEKHRPREGIPRPASRGAVVMTAAQDTESAYETRDPRGRAHGAFTLALLRALRSSAEGESARDVFRRAEAWIAATGRFQRPNLEGLPDLVQAPLFGDRSDRRRHATTLAVEPRPDGRVTIRGGWVDGLEVGSLLRRSPGASENVSLRVTDLEGLGRSLATIEPPGATVAFGELFELVSWVAPAGVPLAVAVPRVPQLDFALQLARELAAICRQGGIRWIRDPTEVSPTHVLRWNGAGFELVTPGKSATAVGARPSAREIAERLPPGAGLFVQLPAPDVLAEGMKLGPGTDHDAVLPTSPARALYVLAGRWTSDGVEYAWIRSGTLADDSMHGMPARTGWHPAPGASDFAEIALALEQQALRLAKIQAWLTLESPPGGVLFPYRLQIVDDRGVVDGGLLRGGTEYRVRLERADQPSGQIEDRYLYVFSIDSSGRSVLIFPPRFLSLENLYPGPLAKPGEPAPEAIALGVDSVFQVVEPFGIDTLFLLSTRERISQPAAVFEYEGVRIQGPKGYSGLDDFLAQTGTTRRGIEKRSVTRSWHLERRPYRTAPASNRKL